MNAQKNPRWRVGVRQISEERIPKWWEKILGDRGNVWAWQAAINDQRATGFAALERWTWGCTRDEVIAKANAMIADIEAKEKMAEKKEVFYVEGS